MPQGNRFSDLIPGYEEQAPVATQGNRFADLIPQTPEDTRMASEKAFSELPFMQKILSAGQAGMSLAGDAGAEIAGAYSGLKRGYMRSLFGLDPDIARMDESRQETAGMFRDVVAPDDPAEQAAKDAITGIAGDAIDSVSRGTREVVAGRLPITAEAKETFINQPVSDSLGDYAFEVTGDPTIATGFYMIPTIAETIVGAKGARSLRGDGPRARAKPDVDADDIPTIDDLKSAASEHYRKIDEIGISIDGETVRARLAEIRSNPIIIKKLNKQTLAVLDAADEMAEARDLRFVELENIRRVLKQAAQAMEPVDRKTAMQSIEKWDDFVDNLFPSHDQSGQPF